MEDKDKSKEKLITSLREHEVNLRGVIMDSADGILVTDAEGVVLLANPVAEEILGRGPNELVGVRLDIPLADGRIEIDMIKPDGAGVPVELWGSETRWNDERAFRIFFRDLTERRQFNREIKDISCYQKERGKELECLYSVSRLAANPPGTIDEAMAMLVTLIPSGWQYPEITGAKIILDGQSYATPNFMETRWTQSADFFVFGKHAGTIEIAYMEERPERDEGPFFKEERYLLDDIARQVGLMIAAEKAKKRERHLNAVLRAIRNVNQLIVQEEDPAGLVQKACELLVETRGYIGACVTFYGSDEDAALAGSAGWNGEFEGFRKMLDQGWLPPCAETASAAAGQATSVPDTFCPDCPLYKGEDKGSASAAALQYEDHCFGILSVTLPTGMAWDAEEESLLSEVAGDLAFALHDIEVRRSRDEAYTMLSAAVKAGSVGLWDFYPQKNRAVFSKEWKQQLGYKPDEIGNSADEWTSRLHPEDRERVMGTLNRYLEGAGKGDFALEFRLCHKDGSYRWIFAHGAAVECESGIVIRMLGSHIDITEQKQTAEALLKSEEKYRRMVASVADVIVMTSPEGVIEDITSNCKRLLGYAPEEVIGRHFDKFIWPDDIKAAEKGFRSQVVGADIAAEYRIRTKSGKPRWMSALGKLNEEEKSFYTVLRDITEKKNDYKKLQQSEELLNETGEMARVGGWKIDLDTDTVIWTQATRAIHEVPDNYIPTVQDAINFFAPEAREKIAEAIRAACEKGVHYDLELPFVTMNGRKLWTRSIGKPEFSDGKCVRLHGTFQDITDLKCAQEHIEWLSRFPAENPNPVIRIALDGTVLYVNGNGRVLLEAIVSPASGKLTPEWLDIVTKDIDSGIANDVLVRAGESTWQATVAPIKNREYVNVYASDITEQLMLESQLRQSQKMESIGTLASGIAHEINNPIMGIMNYAQLIQDNLGPDSPVSDIATEIGHETKRVATIVKSLLSFARHEKQSHSPACVCDIVDSTLSLIRTFIRHDQITLDVDVPEDLPKIKCRSQQIQQVIMNLLTNAVDTLNEKYEGFHENKKIMVTARKFENDGRRLVRMTVEDQGCGIPGYIRERMFDPFYTTKPRDKGTGLGLSISYEIVVEHQGELTVESQVGEFTRIYLDLPVDNGWNQEE